MVDFPEYNHKRFEKKWNAFWERNNVFSTDLRDFNRPKKYILSMFPYPSGSGLHVGHVRNYVLADASARFYRMLGFNVLFPIGWDAFGLPAEQYAIETNNHPSIFTNNNIANFKKQLKSLGFSYDWSKEINTSDPNYYSITQWMFKQILINKLAEYKDVSVFWCDNLSTVLSNEEIRVEKSKIFSERGNYPVVKKNIRQWIIKITKYSKDLVDGLDNLNWPLSIKNLQRNWIGIVEGSKVSFPVIDKNFSLEVFTSRIDTIYGVNSIVVSCLNKICEKVVDNSKFDEFENFKKKWQNIPCNGNLEEIDAFFSGSYCLNLFNNEKLPIWIANFVSNDYGTGCLMISPFIFNKREVDYHKYKCFATKKELKQNFRIDYSFSLKFKLPMKNIVAFSNCSYKYENSGVINEIENKEKAIDLLIGLAEKNKFGTKSSALHLKDWIFSRQRYWGEPIPVFHSVSVNGNNKESNYFLISDDQLPLKLPYLNDFKPSADFYSPLQKLRDWIHFKNNGNDYFRDTNVMPQWAGSCWYYLAFLIVNNKDNNSHYFDIRDKGIREIIDYWMPVDLYIGGQEHANLHLLYARFWNMFLYKNGLISNKEPFKELFCQGMIVSEEDGEKMSKSKGNIINPDYCVEKWGSDSLRLYEMFISPPSNDAIFKISGILSMNKWLKKVYNFFVKERNSFLGCSDLKELDEIIGKTVNNYYTLKFNTIVSNLMIFFNRLQIELKREKIVPLHYAKYFIQLLNPLAPYISEEIWELLSCDKDKCVSNSLLDIDKIEQIKTKKIGIIVQVNNKFKKNLKINEKENSEEEIIKILKNDVILKDKIISRIIFVKGKTINFIINHN
ncbi:MAG TPA: leucine--tRNA ligase [Mycoplasmatales bacterium]|jgi:leucyl-tRNA synthetase|nr:leucine--tRNA ligase [Mycoplasmatales bacterium]